MSGVFQLSLGISQAAVGQTISRVENAADYADRFLSRSVSHGTASQWSEAIENSDVPSLIHQVESHGIGAYRHLEQNFRRKLARLTLESCDLRATLQNGAERIEQEIGIRLPLRLSINPDLSLSLGATQVFHLAQPLSLVEVNRIAEFRSPNHSPKIRGHVAETTIKELAAYKPRGRRVVPLSSPTQVPLGTELIRIGRFTLLGFNGEPGEPHFIQDLERLTSWKGLVDLLLLGGAVAANPAFQDELNEAIRPHVTLIQGAVGTIVFDPIKQWIEVADGTIPRGVPWKRDQNVKELLEGRRASVTQETFGSVLADRKLWRWSQSIMNGVIPAAAFYLLLLERDPQRYQAQAAREDLLMTTIDHMIEGLTLPNAIPDHITAFRETLLQSGLLEQAGGP